MAHLEHALTFFELRRLTGWKPLRGQLVETRMERFKECERESKTKAYSKEGLPRAESGGASVRAWLALGCVRGKPVAAGVDDGAWMR